MISLTKRLLAAAVAVLCALQFAPAVAGTTDNVPAATTPLTGAETIFCDQGTVPNRATKQCKVSDIAGSVVNGGPNTWNGTQTFPGIVLNTATGDYHCIQADPSGALSSAPVPCSGAPVASQIGSFKLGAGKTIVTSGFAVAGDLGAGCIYTSLNATSAGLEARQDATGVWLNLIAAAPINAGCFGVTGNYTAASFNGAISGNVLTASSVGGLIKVGQTVTVPGGASATVTADGTTTNTACGGIQCTGNTTSPGGTFALSGSQTVGLEIMSSAAGTDDSTALQAAFNTGQSVYIPGRAPAINSETPFRCQAWVGVGSPVTAAYARQKVTMPANVCLIPMGSFPANAYVLTLSGGNSYGEGINCDGGQGQGFVAGCIDITGDNGTLNNTYVRRAAVAAICPCNGTAAGGTIIGANIAEWDRGDPQYPILANYVGDGVLIKGGDWQFINLISAWTKINLHFSTGAGTIFFYDTHVYQALNSPYVGTRTDAPNLQVDGDASGAIFGQGFYFDNGTAELYNDYVRLSGTWFVGSGAGFTGSIAPVSGVGVLTASNVSGAMIVGALVTGSGVAANTVITANSGTPGTPCGGSACTGSGGAGTYAVSISQTVGSEAMTALLSTFTNGSFVHVIADGKSAPNRLSMDFIGSGLQSPYNPISYISNPNLVTVTGVTATGTTVTYNVSGWLTNAQQPAAFSSVAIAGLTPSGYNGTFVVQSSTPTSITVNNTTTGATTGTGTIQEVWVGDYSGVPALNPTSTFAETENGARNWINNTNLTDMLDLYEANQSCSNIAWYIGGGISTPPHMCLSAAGMTVGDGAATAFKIRGDDALPSYITFDPGGIQGTLMLGAGGNDVLKIQVGGAVTPAADVLGGTRTLGNPALRWAGVYSYQYNLSAAPWVASTAPIPTGFGTSPSVSGSTDSFDLNVGTGGSATTGFLTLPFAVSNSPTCFFSYFNPTSAELLLTTEETAFATPTNTITSGTYNSGTGAVSLTLSGSLGSPGIPVGGNFTVTGAAGTGSFASINGAQVATSGTATTTVNFTIGTGLTMTITGGTVTGSTNVSLASFTRSSGSATAWPSAAVVQGSCPAH